MHKNACSNHFFKKEPPRISQNFHQLPNSDWSFSKILRNNTRVKDKREGLGFQNVTSEKFLMHEPCETLATSNWLDEMQVVRAMENWPHKLLLLKIHHFSSHEKQVKRYQLLNYWQNKEFMKKNLLLIELVEIKPRRVIIKTDWLCCLYNWIITCKCK